MGKENEEKKEDEKLIPVGDGVDSPEEESRKSSVEDFDEDEKVGHVDAANTDEDDDEEEEGDLSPERKRIREKRRQAKLRRSARIASDRKELDFLRQRNEDLERKFSTLMLRQDRAEVNSIDQRIGMLEGQIREAEAIHTQAVDAKDGTTATEALRVAGALKESLNKLKEDKEERTTQARERVKQQTERPREADPAAVRNGKQWVRKHAEWFDPQLGDDDSYLARAIEERLARSGEYDPADPDYWEELDRRIYEKLPHLRKGGKQDDDLDWEDDDEKPKKPPKKKPGGPRIAVGGRTRALKPNEVYISEERKKALMQAGVWDDDEKRERYLQSYRKWDEEAARNS